MIKDKVGLLLKSTKKKDLARGGLPALKLCCSEGEEKKRSLGTMIYIETGCKKHHLTPPCFTFLLFHPSTRSRKCNFVNPPSRSKCYHVLMAATHPPVSPVEEPHQQCAFRKSQDSLINLLIVPERDKDGYCRSTDGKRKEKQSWNSVIGLHHMRQWRTWKEDKRQRKLMKTALCFVSVVTLTRLKVEQYDSSIVCRSIKEMGEWQWCSTRLPPSTAPAPCPCHRHREQ